MGGSNFELIAQELLRHQKIMEEMEAENRWLRQELANIRAGQGIFLIIEGKRIPLAISVHSAPQISQPQPVEQSAPAQSITQEEDIPALQRRTTMPLLDEEESEETKEPKVERTPFLEEIMIDEFSAALTSPNAVWQGPIQKRETIKKPEQIDEDEMAALRRDLMGSFLLE